MLHPLQILKDRIISSETHVSSRLLHPEDVSILQHYIGDLDSYIQKLSSLSIVYGTTFNLLDYDDTLHPRHYQLQRGILRDNRGKLGNKVIDEVLGREKVLDRYYRRSSIVKRIAQILEAQDQFHVARVLTAGVDDWQIAKTKNTRVYDSKNGILVVDDAKLKIQKILDAILELGYIPAKIIIYEDRPEHFNAVAKALSKFLGGSEIVVNHVILSKKEVILRQIQEIRQKIYQCV